MKKTLAVLSALAFGGTALTTATTVQAASEDECAIWICLPGGFPSGCGAAHSAMKKRVKDLKPPLPQLSACMVDGDTGGASSNDGRAAYIPKKDSWVRDTTCQRHRSDRYPSGCTETGYYAEVFVNGAKQGDTYYFLP